MQVVTPAKEYIGEIKIYNTGIKEDPVPGEKRGKGVQALNSSYWLSDLGAFIPRNIKIMKEFLKYGYEKAKGQTEADFLYYINQSNQLAMKAENEGLATQDGKDYFLMGSWLAMAAAEVDQYHYSKYSPEERKQMRENFYQRYFQEADLASKDGPGQEQLGKFFAEPSRIDLIPPVALERLGIHNELCVVKWGEENSTQWKREGFPLSRRISSLKRHFDGVHSKDHSEDHIAHLIWNFMAVYHVLIMRPDLNDLSNFEGIRKAHSQPSATSNN
eukprot:TRINITY_DN3252_c0_g1_i1.p1 TRINITY_DN3252_c0_g1~~TRINITY_DN3252_c0_g1_i1.p1  ORF type:complete len:294 (+),score=84.67 TRINITY_DN3252_c0_g1_i1:65-883(+)